MSDAQDEIEQEDFATLFAREGARWTLEVGQVVKGRILQIGDGIEATVVKTGDEVRLSSRLPQGIQAREGLAVAARTGLPVEGKVADVPEGASHDALRARPR